MRRVAAAVLTSALLLGVGPRADAGGAVVQAVWSPTGEMSLARQNFTATLLDDGRVLVTGGFASVKTPLGTSFFTTDLVEIYDPATRRWSPAPSLSAPRSRHTATRLLDGRVLVAGGSTQGTQSAEIFDPATSSWSPAASMADRRTEHTATLIDDGRVLVAGGSQAGPSITGAELYDPTSDSWSSAGSMADSRNAHAAVLLGDGAVLVMGGIGSSGARRGAELYDPVTHSWSPTGGLAADRFRHTATWLPDGRVLVAGGSSALSEVYDPATGTWSPAGVMAELRRDHTATLLADGTVLATGGDPGSGGYASTEIYDPSLGMWTEGPPMSEVRTRHSAVLLRDDNLLATGGATFPGPTCCIRSAELYGNGPGPLPFFVDTTEDGADAVPGDFSCDDGAGRCTLRAAIMESNALAGANLVSLGAGVHTLTLHEPIAAGAGTSGAGALAITDALILAGSGADESIIDALGSSGVVSVSGGGPVTIAGVTIRGGATESSGAGLLNSGIVTVVDSAVTGNVSLGLFGGGGIHNLGRLDVLRTTVSGNVATRGGGILNSGQLIVALSTISGNLARPDLSQPPGSAQGGGIYNTDIDGYVILFDSTLAHNLATGRGGGFVTDCPNEICASFRMRGSIIANNLAPVGPNCVADSDLFGSGFGSNGFNLVGNADGCPFNPAAGDLVGSGASPIDPGLAPLGHYGGSTQTHALLPGSVSIDHLPAGECSALTDQRGVVRPQGPGCDLGAYESAACTLELRARRVGPGVEVDFLLGAGGPATWTTGVVLAGQLVPLWSLPIPAVDPPFMIGALPFGDPGPSVLGVFSVLAAAGTTPCVAFEPFP